MAGEFFVAAELSKRGYSVSLTMGNAKAVDLFAERDGRAVCIQVKARTDDTGWRLPPDKADILENVLYVCVALNGIGQPPDYYVLTPQEVRDGARTYSDPPQTTLYIAQIRDRKDAWHLIEEALGALHKAASPPPRLRSIRRDRRSDPASHG